MARQRDADDYRLPNVGHPALAELRLRRVDGRPASDDDYRGAFRELVEQGGDVPEGWEATAVRWGVRRPLRDQADVPDPYVSWAHGDTIDLAGFGSTLGYADLGVTRRVEEREITATEWVTEVTTVLTGNERWVSVGTKTKSRGAFVSAAYAARYPGLVALQPRVRERVRRRKQIRVTRLVEIEEAVVRLTYNLPD